MSQQVYIAVQHDPDLKRHCPELGGTDQDMMEAFRLGVESTMRGSSSNGLHELTNPRLREYFRRGQQVGHDHHEVI